MGLFMSIRNDVCPECYGRGIVTATTPQKYVRWDGSGHFLRPTTCDQCKTNRELLDESMRWKDRVPAIFTSATINTLLPRLRVALTPFISGDLWFATLWGPSGRGKTWASWAIARTKKFHEVAFLDVRQLNKNLLDRLASPPTLRCYERAQLLIIDDYGVDLCENAQRLVDWVICHRHDQKMKTLITTNLNPETDFPDGRIARRCCENQVVLNVTRWREQ